jgi:menaquinone-dependent protoporphyrinogen oxidase
MEEKVLVTYASTHGSTQEVAEVVAATLRAAGQTVDLQPLRSVRTLEGYTAVVLGAPIYMFHWHKDVLHFLSQNRKALTGDLPIAIFTGGPFSTGDEKEWQTIRDQVDQELAKYAWLKPVSVEIIGGRFDPAKLRFPWNLLPALKRMPAADLRDWAAIHAWVDRLSPVLTRAGH